MAGFYTSFKEFQNYYCNKFGRQNPLPWQDGMQAIIWWITENLPENTRATVGISASPTGVTISGKGTDESPYIWAFNFNENEVKGPQGEQGPAGATGPQGPAGESGLNAFETYETYKVPTSPVISSDGVAYDVESDLYKNNQIVGFKTGTVKLPVIAGNGISFSIDPNENVLVISASGGGGSSLYFHTITLEGAGGAEIYKFSAITNTSTHINTWALFKANINKIQFVTGIDNNMGWNYIAMAYAQTPIEGLRGLFIDGGQLSPGIIEPSTADYTFYDSVTPL